MRDGHSRNHGRIRRCFLTEKGARIAEACFPVAQEVEQKLLALFDDNQRAELAELLRLYLGQLPPEPPPHSDPHVPSR